MPQKKMVQWPVLVGIGGVILVLMMYWVFTQYDSPKNRVMRALSLGERYLLEENYEQSIIQFTNAIQIAQSQPSIMYLAEDAQQQLDVAICSGAVAQVQAEGGDLQSAVTWLESVQCEEQPAGQIFVNALSLLEWLQDLCEDQDYGSIFSLLADETFQQTVAEVMGLDCQMRLLEGSTMTAVYQMKVNTENFADGSSTDVSVPGIATPEQAAGIPDEASQETTRTVGTDYMIYYGNHSNGMRQGQGLWLAYQNGNNYRANGQWENDMPNGNFESRSWQADLETSVTYRVIQGNVVDGLWNGAVTWSFERGDETDHYNPSFDKGYWVVLREESGYAIVDETDPNDRLIAEDQDKTHGIAGYAEVA